MIGLIDTLFSPVFGWLNQIQSYLYATLDQIAPTGLLTTIPLVCIAILWIYFVVKVINLIGNKGSVK